MRSRILIADDHWFVRQTVRELLLTFPSFEVCGEAENGGEAIEKVLELRPDVVLLDISMPVMNGALAAQTIAHVSPATKIVFLTVHDIPERTQALAHGFVSKFDAGTELIPTLSRLGNVKYRWQQLVADALQCPTKDLPHKINAAEQAISRRLVEINPAEKEERKALKEALQTLGKLLRECKPSQEPSKQEDIA